MKIKYIALMLASVLMFGTFTVGCSKQSEDQQQHILDSREVDFSSIGLKYTTPENWQEYMKSNSIYPYAYEENFTIENIRYNYITPDDWNTISKASEGFSLDDYLYPICEIVVVQDDKADNLKTSGLYTTFSSRELISQNNGVSYYLFSDYVGSIRKMGKENVEIYDNICASVDELANSVVVSDFDVEAYVEEKYAEKNTISFSSETLNGKDIDSGIFSQYDITLFYVWGTYIYPGVDNLAEIQKAYEHAKELGNVNVVALCIDTPHSKLDNSPEAQKLVKTASEAFEKVGAEFEVIRLDSNLAAFIQNNFDTIPAFTMVDRKGVARGGYYEGVYSGDDYVKFIDAALNEYVENAEK
ncbi:hypothetical protein IMSAG049_00531 [Clostridiales bacterium]|nr:hypothetical protein IMSAG049_00531 [Clostridiales bacterium]